MNEGNTVWIPNQDTEVEEAEKEKKAETVREEAAPRSYEARPSNGTYCHNPRDIIISSNVGNDSHDPVTEENGNSKQQRHPNRLSILVMHQFYVEVHESLIVL